MDEQRPQRKKIQDQATVAPTDGTKATVDFTAKSTGGGGGSSVRGPTPTSFGRYQIQRTLGEGGMGAVYLAKDAELERQVALKVPFVSPDEQSAILDRFKCEAKAVAALQHPNICPIFDVGQVDGKPYMAMAYIKGKPLEDFIDPDKPLPIRSAVQMVAKIATALEYAHQQGVIHRDLKPANIMVNERREPIIMDFGLARRETEKDETRLTKAGTMMGTPAYMPPEQVAGDVAKMGPGSDIYSLGVILYELLTSDLPFKGDLLSIVSQIAMKPPPPPSELRPAVDAELTEICAKAMAKEPKDRFASMGEFAKKLTDYGRKLSQSSASAERATMVAPAPNAAAPKRTAQPTTLPTAATAATDSKDSARSFPTVAIVAMAVILLAAGGAFAVFKFRTVNGTLVVEVNQPGVEVFLDGQLLRIKTPDANEPVEVEATPGEHELKVTKAGFAVYTKAFTLKSGGKDAIKVQLEPADKPTPSVVAVPPEPSTPKPTEPVAATPKPSGDNKRLPDPPLGKDVPIAAIFGQPAPFSNWSMANSLSFSPDGTKLTTGSNCMSFNVWNVPSGTPICGIFNGGIAAGSVAFLPDGKRVVVGGGAGNIHIRDAATGAKIAELERIPNINQFWIEVSADGSKIAAGNERNLAVWDGNSMKVLFKRDEPTSLPGTFSPDGSTLAVPGSKAGVVLLDASTGKPRWQTESFDRSVRNLAFHPGGQWIGCMADERQIIRLDAATGKELSPIAVSVDANIHRFAIRPDGKSIAMTGNQTSHIYFVDSETGALQSTWKRVTPHSTAIRFSPDSKRLAAITYQWNAISLWNIDEQREETADPAHCVRTQSVCFLKGLPTIVSKHCDGSIRGWDLPSGRPTFRLQYPSDVGIFPAAQPGQFIVADSKVALHDGTDGRLIHEFSAGNAFAKTATDDGSRVVVGYSDGGVKIFNVETQKEEQSFKVEWEGKGGTIRKLSWTSQEAPLIIEAELRDKSRLLSAWDAAKGAMTLQKKMPTDEACTVLAYRPADRSIIIGYYRTVRILDAKTFDERQAMPINLGYSLKLAIAPSDRFAAVAGTAGKVRLFEPATLKTVAEYAVGPTFGPINDLGFSPDSRYFATANCNGSIYVIAVPDQGNANSAASADSVASGSGPIPAKAPFTPEVAKQLQTDWAKSLNVPVELTNSIGMKLVLVPPGEFMMGLEPDKLQRTADEIRREAKDLKFVESRLKHFLTATPRHRVRITKPLYVGACEVTVGQFRQFVNSTKHQTEPEKIARNDKSLTAEEVAEISWSNPKAAPSEMHPVGFVNWSDAVAFPDWLSQKEGRKYRLPTEAEWEYFAGAGNEGRWCFGDDRSRLTDFAWTKENSQKTSHPVGSKNANAFGLFDVHGSRREWCADFGDPNYYAASPVDDPAGPAESSETRAVLHLGRGGHFRSNDWHTSTTAREWGRAQINSWEIDGFRVVASIQP